MDLELKRAQQAAQARGYELFDLGAVQQLTKERDDLREALADAVELIERELSDPARGERLLSVHRVDPDKLYNIAGMRELLANLNKTDPET